MFILFLSFLSNLGDSLNETQKIVAQEKFQNQTILIHFSKASSQNNLFSSFKEKPSDSEEIRDNLFVFVQWTKNLNFSRSFLSLFIKLLIRNFQTTCISLYFGPNQGIRFIFLKQKLNF